MARERSQGAPDVHQSVVRIDVHLGPDELARQLREEAAAGLAAVPKRLSPKWFYDERGSRLFDEITRLPEYYPTRCERSILSARAPAIADEAKADTLVELGSGTSEKTELLLDALEAAGALERYVPFDVDEVTERDAAHRIADRHPGIEVHGVVGDFEHHLHCIPGGGRRLIAFLGGTIGNLERPARARFLRDVSDAMTADDAFLLGTDLVKDERRLVAAYDDARGVTAAFNRNVLLVLNRELGARFDPDRFTHVARWNAEHERIEMWLRSTVDQLVAVEALGVVVPFDAGEEMLTETSAKFRRRGVVAELAAAGLEVVSWWEDGSHDFALSLSRLRTT